MEGQYINIVIPGKRAYLALCEVKVMGQRTEMPASTGNFDSFLFFHLFSLPAMLCTQSSLVFLPVPADNVVQ